MHHDKVTLNVEYPPCPAHMIMQLAVRGLKDTEHLFCSVSAKTSVCKAEKTEGNVGLNGTEVGRNGWR